MPRMPKRVTKPTTQQEFDKVVDHNMDVLPPEKAVVGEPSPKKSKLAARIAANKVAKPVTTTATQPSHLIVEARAGTGKTTTIVEGLKHMRGLPTTITPSPQQAAIWEQILLSKDAKTVCMVAFNKSIAEELKRRIPPGCEAMTMHSMGFKAVLAAFPQLRGRKLNEYRTEHIALELLGIEQPNLATCTPSEKSVFFDAKRKHYVTLSATTELVGLCKVNLVNNPTEEDLDQLARYYDVQLTDEKRYGSASGREVGNKSYRSEVFALVPKVLQLCRDPQQGGMIDFDDMIWLPVVLDLPMFKYDLLLVDEAQDLNRCQQALAKRAGKRLILVGDPKQCHPAGVLVTKTGGRKVPIETLRVGNMLATFNPNSSYISGLRTQGRRVEAIAHREYEGDLYTINGTPCTPNHRWITRFPDSAREKTALYLMELADGSFRIGQTQLLFSDGNGFGPGLRARQEGGTRIWLLDAFDDKTQAREAEFKDHLRFQIPQRAQYEEHGDQWPRELIDEGVEPQVDALLSKYGRMRDFPIWEIGEGSHIGRYSFVTQACNLIQSLSLIAKHQDGTNTVRWEPLELSVESGWTGTVYSIQVQPTERGRRLYIANGNVTHNSIYGFAGADCDSMPRMAKELGSNYRLPDYEGDGVFGPSHNPGCITLPLTVTRRCGRAIVAEANKVVKDFTAHESNPDGEVLEAMYPVQKDAEGGTKDLPIERTYLPLVQPGDMVLCRVNAPLVSQCFRLIRMGKRANIQGRDVGKGLVSLVKKLWHDGLNQAGFRASVEEWSAKEVKAESGKNNPSEARIIAINDKEDCLLCFAEEATTAEDCVRRIEAIFTDNRDVPGIRLSSIHKAKGLEARRVFFLQPEGGRCPHPMAKSAWQREQESNLLYVGITRAIETLYFVS